LSSRAKKPTEHPDFKIIAAFAALIDTMGLTQSDVYIYVVTSPEKYWSAIPDGMKAWMLAYESNTETFVSPVRS
jgi:hypothetical protein